MSESINMLTGVKVAELSIVRRGANGKRIALTKGDTMEFNEILKNVLETPAEGEEKYIEVLKSQGLDEEAQKAALAQFRTASGFKDQLTDEAFEAMAKAAGYDLEKAKKKEDDEEDLEDDKLPFQRGKKKKKKEEEDMKKSGEEVTLKSLQKNFDDQSTKLEELRKSNETKDSEIAEIKKSAERKELIVECEKSFPCVPGLTYDVMADTLLASSDTVKETLRKSWKETSEAVSKSELINTIGRQGSGDGSSDAMTKFDNLVKEKVAKSDITKAKAFKNVMDENPALYQEYLNENPAQS